MRHEALVAVAYLAQEFAERRYGVNAPDAVEEAAWLRSFFRHGMAAALSAQGYDDEAHWFRRLDAYEIGVGPRPGAYPTRASNAQRLGVDFNELLVEGEGGDAKDNLDERLLLDTAAPSAEAPASLQIHAATATDISAWADVTAPLFQPADLIEAADAASGWVPSSDQTQALQILVEAFHEAGFYVLTGAAGCGKTTVLKALLRRLSSQWNIILIAPTWRAANVMRDILGMPAASIHSAVYGAPITKRRCPVCQEWEGSLMEAVQVTFHVGPDGELTLAPDAVDAPEGFEAANTPPPSAHTADARPANNEVAAPDEGPPKVSLPRYRCESCDAVLESAAELPQRLDFARKVGEGPGEERKPYRLVVVDEMGMVSAKVLDDVRAAFLDPRTRILGVGDPNQLPAVSEGEDVPTDPLKVEDTTVWPTLETPTAMLHTVHRQAAGDPILTLAHTMKVWPPSSSPDPEWPFPSRMQGIEIVQKADISVPARWAAHLRHAGKDMALIAYSNKTRALLNHEVRVHSGAVAHAAHYGVNLIPGDRLLARANYGGVFNGDVFTLYSIKRVPPGRMLTSEGRVPVKDPKYEHDRVLGPEVGVFRVELYRAERPEVRKHAVLVLPLRDGVPLVESDLIRSGTPPNEARRILRDIARCWIAEAEKALEDQAVALSARQDSAEACKIAAARWKSGERILRANLLMMVRDLRKHGANSEALDELIATIESGALDSPQARAAHPCSALASRYEPLLRYATVLDYCVEELGMVPPADVAVFDFGEALTCHAMQGSQARIVGVVPDGAFWYRWREDRRATMQWCYTAYTRAADALCLFSIRRPA